MTMECSKSLASMLLSLLLIQVQPLRNVKFGFQLVPYLKTFFRGHHPIYAIHLNTLFLPGMMVCNQIILLSAIQAGCVSHVVCQAITSDNALQGWWHHVDLVISLQRNPPPKPSQQSFQPQVVDM